MKTEQDPNNEPGVRVEIDTATLVRLLGNRQIGACELKCLDARSRQEVRQICLNTCLLSGIKA